MFFKIGSPKNFSISTVNTSLWVLKACNFIKKRTQNRSFPVNIAKFLGTAFFIEHLGRLLQTVLSQYSKVSWDVCSLISCLYLLPCWSKSYTKRCTNNSFSSHYKATPSCLNSLIMYPRFQTMFWKNISCFRFWWKCYTKRCTNIYVITRFKRLYSAVLWGWPSAFSFRIWFGKRKSAV